MRTKTDWHQSDLELGVTQYQENIQIMLHLGNITSNATRILWTCRSLVGKTWRPNPRMML